MVVGSGPNGLAAALTCAEAGRSVLVLEAKDTIGGGCRTAELTLPGFAHDVCSAVHPLAAVSPFFASLGLERHGLELLHPAVALAHPIEGDRVGVLHRSLDETAAGLGPDGRAWDRHVGMVARHWDELAPALLGPLLRIPRHPLALASFAWRGLLPATVFARAFETEEAQALFAGAAAHGFLPLSRPLTSSFGMMLLGSAHVAGWPVARGGSQAIVEAMAGLLTERGGRVETDREVRTLADVPSSRAVLFDVTPRQLLDICGDELPPGYRRRLGRFRYGPGVFKLDYALSGPVPWRNPECSRAGTVHLGGPLGEVAAAEAEVAAGRHPDRPFVLVGQQSVADPTRAPAGQHTLWAYCHVPAGSDVDMTDAIEHQIDRFAPGFRDVVLARHAMGSGAFEDHNPNLVGGDIAGGSHGGLQLVMRPRPGVPPYRTGNPRLYLCSASTPPGAGVHGMCGLHAARAALAGVLS